MNIPAYILVLVLLASLVHGQDNLKYFKDSTEVKTYLLLRGATLKINTDSAMIMNRRTYQMYETYRLNNAAFQDMEGLYDSLIGAYQYRMDEQTREYKSVRGLLDSLSIRSLAFSDRTEKSLDNISDSLNVATQSLKDAQGLLESTRTILKKEKKKMVLGRLYWGIGGIAIGSSLAFIILSVTN